MHARRRFVDALALVNTDGMDPGIIYDLPEMKAVILINRVYEADEPLKAEDCSSAMGGVHRIHTRV